jgi:hypothetical protein
MTPTHPIEHISKSLLCKLSAAAHVKCCASRMNRVLFAVFLSLSCAHAAELTQLKNPELAVALALSEKLSERDGIRIFAVPTVDGECWGKLSSCPDIRLLVTIGPEMLYQNPALYELPRAKGWKFVGWKGRGDFVVRTDIPDENLDNAERKRWRSIEYRVRISEKGAVYQRR